MDLAHILFANGLCAKNNNKAQIFMCVVQTTAFRRGKLATRLANHVILFFMPGQTFYLNYESKVRANFFNEFIAFN